MVNGLFVFTDARIPPRRHGERPGDLFQSTFFFLQKPIKKILCNATIVFHGIL